MNTVVKLLIGLLVVIAGAAWYWYGEVFKAIVGVTSLKALLLILAGSIGFVLIIIGLFVVWVEIEEIRDAIGQKKLRKKEKNKKVKKK